MKTRVIIIVLFLCSAYTMSKAQQPTLAADQNPRYAESQSKYTQLADSLLSTQGTTIQNTYKAYDWYESKLERRQQNREWRHQEYMNGGYYTPSWGLSGGYSPFNYGYGSRWGRGGYWGSRSSFGIGFGWY